MVEVGPRTWQARPLEVAGSPVVEPLLEMDLEPRPMRRKHLRSEVARSHPLWMAERATVQLPKRRRKATGFFCSARSTPGTSWYSPPSL